MSDRTDRPWASAEVLPHRDPMNLLDEVVSFGEGRLEAAVTVRADAPFFRDGAMPVHVAIEFMAQACGAYAGVRARLAGREPQIGYLLGTRDFEARRDRIEEGTHLSVIAVAAFDEGNMGVFDCEVMEGAERLCRARLTVYQPEPTGTVARGAEDE